MADGNIKEDSIWIGLSEKDKEHLENFAKALGLTDSVRSYLSVAGGILKGRKYVRVILEVTSKLLVKSIKKNFNVLPQKTLKPYVPPEQVKDNYAKAFLAGLIDGDGFINTYESDEYIRFGFIGSKEICNWGAEVANKELIRSGRKPTASIRKPSDKNYWEMRCTGQNAQILLSQMEKVCQGLVINRKWDIYKSFAKRKIWQKDKTRLNLIP